MSDNFTEPPWSADVAGLIYAVNGRAGQTTVATLIGGAPAEVLAAAPDLLRAVEDSMESLGQILEELPIGAIRNAMLEAREFADTAIKRATVAGYPDASIRERLWKVDPTLPAGEKKANERLLDAAPDLRKAALEAYRVLATRSDSPAVIYTLQHLIAKTEP